MDCQIKKILHELLILSMLKTDKKNCLKILNNLKNNEIEILLSYIENTVLALVQDNSLTRNMVDNIHEVYDYLLTNNSEFKTLIVESYNMIKGKLNCATYDGMENMLFEDIMVREYGAFSYIYILLNKDKFDDFYAYHYQELMEDIAFDYDVIAYLTNEKLNNKDSIVYDLKFSKSIRYLCMILPEILNDPVLKNNLENILKIGKKDKKIKKSCQKTLRIIKKLQ